MTTCDARKPGFALRPQIGINSLPCALRAGHASDHRNVAGRSWPRTEDSAEVNGVTSRIVNDDLTARTADDEGRTDPRGGELLALQAQASKLWTRMLAGEDTPYLRTRIERLEAIQAALLTGDVTRMTACRCGGTQHAAA
ncbi:hypothetical protein [Streptomyces sp. A30]|uniref:hypothetical protein n=1 Tax=Streptomyces sp. A30 TaxID=2789273 RepID=UPI00398093DB